MMLKAGLPFSEIVELVMNTNSQLDRDTVEKVCCILEDANYRKVIDNDVSVPLFKSRIRPDLEIGKRYGQIIYGEGLAEFAERNIGADVSVIAVQGGIVNGIDARLLIVEGAHRERVFGITPQMLVSPLPEHLFQSLSLSDYGKVKNYAVASTAFMTSPIGDLSIDSDGLRKAIDEIARLRGLMQEGLHYDK